MTEVFNMVHFCGTMPGVWLTFLTVLIAAVDVALSQQQENHVPINNWGTLADHNETVYIPHGPLVQCHFL